MKFLVLTTITEPLKVGDIIHSDTLYLGSNFYSAIGREGHQVQLHSCDQHGALTTLIKTFVLTDRKTIGSLVWKKVGYTMIPPKY